MIASGAANPAEGTRCLLQVMRLSNIQCDANVVRSLIFCYELHCIEMHISSPCTCLSHESPTHRLAVVTLPLPHLLSYCTHVPQYTAPHRTYMYIHYATPHSFPALRHCINSNAELETRGASARDASENKEGPAQCMQCTDMTRSLPFCPCSPAKSE